MKNYFNEEDLNREFNAKKSASDKDVNKILGKVKKIMSIIRSNEDLAKFLDNVSLFIQLLRDYITGKYREVPVGTIAAIVGALAYLLCPVDLIPDFIPGIGYVDDAAVLAMCIRLVKYDLDKYKVYKDNYGLQVA